MGFSEENKRKAVCICIASTRPIPLHMLYQVIKKFQAIRESSESFDENTEIRQGTIYDMCLLLHSLEIGAIDFRQFLDESVKWSQQVLDAKKQKETTSTE